jgi:hypothetical protein
VSNMYHDEFEVNPKIRNYELRYPAWRHHQVFVNGLLQRRDKDYVLDGKQLTMIHPGQKDDYIQVFYDGP